MKQVKSIEDIEAGMFVKITGDRVLLITSSPQNGEIRSSFNFSTRTSGGAWTQVGFVNKFESWSYTYEGEYTPIVKKPDPTPEQLKIKELEETIANASKQLQELKELSK